MKERVEKLLCMAANPDEATYLESQMADIIEDLWQENRALRQTLERHHNYRLAEEPHYKAGSLYIQTDIALEQALNKE